MKPKSRRRAAMSIFIAGLLLLAAPHAVQAGPRDPPPKELCSDPSQEGNTIPYPPLPEFFEWKCFCYQVFQEGQIEWVCEWELVRKEPGAASRGWVFSSPTFGCLFAINTVVSDYFGALSNAGVGQGLAESYPCNHAKPNPQPPGQLRSQAVFEYYASSSWHPCTALGYSYSGITTNSVTDFFNMGSTPDCGAKTYRLSNTIGIWEGGAWRGGTLWAPNIFMN